MSNEQMIAGRVYDTGEVQLSTLIDSTSLKATPPGKLANIHHIP